MGRRKETERKRREGGRGGGGGGRERGSEDKGTKASRQALTLYGILCLSCISCSGATGATSLLDRRRAAGEGKGGGQLDTRQFGSDHTNCTGAVFHRDDYLPGFTALTENMDT